MDHIINKLQTTIWELTSSELKSKDDIINKLINQKNCEENTNKQSLNKSKFNQNFIDNIQGKKDIKDSNKNNNERTSHNNLREQYVGKIKKTKKPKN